MTPRRDNRPDALPDRVAALEARVLALAARLETLPDIGASAPLTPGPSLDALLAELDAMTALVRADADPRRWDAADQLQARLLLQTLAAIAVELRRAFAACSARLEEAADDVRPVRRALAGGRDLQRRQQAVAEAHATLTRLTALLETDALPAPAAPRD